MWSLCPQCSALEFELGWRGTHGGDSALEFGVDLEVFVRRGSKRQESLAVFDLGGTGRVFRSVRELLQRLELAAELDAWSGGRPCSVRRVCGRETAARR